MWKNENLFANYVETKKYAKEKDKKNEELKVVNVWKWNNEEEWFEAKKNIKLKEKKWDEKINARCEKDWNWIDSRRRNERTL